MSNACCVHMLVNVNTSVNGFFEDKEQTMYQTRAEHTNTSRYTLQACNGQMSWKHKCIVIIVFRPVIDMYTSSDIFYTNQFCNTITPLLTHKRKIYGKDVTGLNGGRPVD